MGMGASIGDVAESMRNGVYKPASDYGPDGVITLRMYNIEDGRLLLYNLKRVRLSESELEHFGLKGGDILINRVNSTELVGKACIIPEDAGPLSYESKNIRLRLASGAESQFVNEWLRTAHARQILQYSCKQTTNMASVDQGTIASLPLPLPPSNEQRRIVAKIEALQERSRKARAALEAIPPLLEQFRQSVLAAAFRGDLTADWRAQHPDVEPASVLRDRIRVERRSRWEEAELAKMRAKGRMLKDEKWKERYKEAITPEPSNLSVLPEKWTWVSVDAVLLPIETGKSFRCEERPPLDDEVGVVKINAVTWGEYQEEESKTCLDPDFIEERLFIQAGDFLFSRANTIQLVGAAVIVRQTNKRVMLSDKVLRFRVAKIPPKWLLYFLRSPYGRKEIERLATGNQDSMRNIGQDRIRQIHLPLPPLDEIEHLILKLESSLLTANGLETTANSDLELIDQLDQSILAKAFHGELVPQDPNDEPASVLLERIRAEREAPSAKPRAKKKTPGSTKRTKKAPPVSMNENDDLPLFSQLQK